MPPRRLIIFTRYPVPGFTKTRLIPALGEHGAADLQRAMTRYTIDNVRPLMMEGVRIEIRHEGGDPSLMAQWLGEDLTYVSQGKGNLGVRMGRAFRQSAGSGSGKTVIIGTDCPGLTAQDIREAFNNLESNQVVFGPAADGGYYLIGLRNDASERLYDTVFSNIPWGTDSVLSSTVNALADAGIGLGLLEERADVDEPEDLLHWERIISARCGVRGAEEEHFITRSRTETGTGSPITSSASISVIFPTLNEEENIGQAIERLKGYDVEIIVADGGSSDGTADICRRAGVRFFISAPGRASQMNAGAEAACGQILLFLHADTKLPDRFEEMIRGIIAIGCVGGAFAFGTDLRTSSMRLIEWAANARARHFGIVFGDQAIFTRSDIFRKVGGYPVQPVMEDMELVRRLKRQGRFVILKQRAVSSARKWRSNGVWRITLMNQKVMWLYLLGARPEKLIKWYKGKLGFED